MQVRGAEVGAQRRVGVPQLPQDVAVELGADAVELHDVPGILLHPETLKVLHQVTCGRRRRRSEQLPAAGGRGRRLTEALLEVLQRRRLRSHVEQVGLQGPAHQQRVRQLRDVDANDGEREAAKGDKRGQSHTHTLNLHPTPTPPTHTHTHTRWSCPGSSVAL